MAVPKGTRIGGRQKGTLNKTTADIRQIALKMSPDATKRLGALLRSENETVAMAAVREVYDRAYGKATQIVAGDNDGGAMRLVHEIVLRGVRSDANH